ncbi:thiamine/thiamine pyrophosphate ABC transporter permease ThiP [Mesocricetibacter intestinalis]|nr:thiamine/thiamine pyrophosphate ABC transporter permease ThiP [Mesocricetibacter intestinalis]
MRPALFFARFRPAQYAGGILVLVLLFAVYGGALHAVLAQGETESWRNILQDAYVRQVIFFSVAQAFLSALFSVLIGLLFARAFFYQRFPGKNYLRSLFSLTFVLPSLAVIFGLFGVYGASGWLAQFAARLGIELQPNIYGLKGILLAHLFFNIPLAARMFLPCFAAIPNQQRQLAAQLNIRGWHFIRLIEFPYWRQQLLPVAILIFMLCFTSFAIVLTLGGGPQFTTLEVAIYQAVVFDFDLSKAAFFTLLQFVFCFVLFSFGSRFGVMAQTETDQLEHWFAPQSSAVKLWQVFFITLMVVFLLLPLLNILWAGLSSAQLSDLWQNPFLWRAFGYSLSIALSSALLALLMAYALLLVSRRLHWIGLSAWAEGLMNLGMVVLAVPAMVLAIGLFLLLQGMEFNKPALFGVVVLCNGLSAMPFVLRVLSPPMRANMQYYEKLCQSLGIRGWRRFKLIEGPLLAAPFKYAFALSCCLSLGDFTAIALFGSRDFSSLPYLLYQQLGSYRGDQAAVTAMVLLLFCLAVFRLAESYAPGIQTGKDTND